MRCKKIYSVCFLFFLLIVIDVRAFTQSALGKKVTFELKNADLKRILKEIEDQAQIKFAYSSENIRGQKLSVTARNEQVSEVLDKILDDQLAYEAIGDMIILRKANEIYDPILVSGKIVDENGNPLPGVTVKVKGNTIGTSTDSNGMYSLRVPDDNSTLVFSFLGFNIQEIAINKQATINLSMVPDTQALNEVIVIGYGTQKRENVIGSVAQVGTKEIADYRVNLQPAHSDHFLADCRGTH